MEGAPFLLYDRFVGRLSLKWSPLVTKSDSFSDKMYNIIMSPVRTSFIKSLFKPRRRAVTYDPAHQEPVIHKSICTGEATVGLVDTDTGKYHELRRVTGEKDIVRFCKDAGIDREKIKTIY